MRHANKAVHFWMLAAFVGVVLAFSAPLHAQTGAPIIKTSTSTTPDPIFIDAYVYTNGSSGITDICSRIKTAWTNNVSGSVPSVTIDARGFTGGGWTCTMSPFPSSVAEGGRLLLGNVTIPTPVTWSIPSGVHVEGMGVSGLSNATTQNTVIQAAWTIASSETPVIDMGGSGLSFDVQVKGLTIDCMGKIECTGIRNAKSEEGSTVEDVNIWNAPTYGLHVIVDNVVGPPPVGAQNSGPYHNINIQYNSNCSSCSASVPILIEDPSTISNQGRVVRAFDSITVSGAGITEGTIGIHINGVSTHITNSHVEYFTTGIEIGDTLATNSVEIENVSVAVSQGGSGVDIGSKAGDIAIVGLTHGSSSGDILNDHVTGNQVTGSFLGWYFLGEGTGTTAAVLSSIPVTTGITWQAPQNLNVVNSLTSTTLNVTGSKHFKIDDPLDPAHKYLYHSVVESPDMMNVYNGSATTDKHGIAKVKLPEYFEALNRDFRYQLTVLGQFAQATVGEKVKDNQFVIKTSKPGVEVSWQVTGIRQDAYANAHPTAVEEEKPPRERGHYLHPELFDLGGKGAVAEQTVGK